MKLLTVFEKHELEALQTAVVVEGWKHIKYGRVKRAWLKEFTEKERAKAGVMYREFYRWHLVTGIPQHGRAMRLETYEFIKRLCNFFGTEV